MRECKRDRTHRQPGTIRGTSSPTPKHRVAVLLIPLMAVTLSSCSGPQVTAPEDTLNQELQSALNDELGRYNVKGASAAVIIPGRAIWTGVSGVSHEGAPVTSDMLFCLGSVTKTFTASVILQLMEEKRLSLDDSLHEWLPPLAHIDSTITITQLLNHTSGLFNYNMHPTFDSRLNEDLSRRWTPEETITTFSGEPYGPPGLAYNYSNTNYVLLGMIIERVTGTTVAAALRTRILSPCALERTFLPVEEVMTGPIAHPWLDVNHDDIKEDCSDMPITAAYSLLWAAGALHTTARDLAVFSNALLNEKTVLGQSTLDEMLDFYPVGDLGYGLGISITEDFIEGVQGIGHDGHSYGYGARMVFIPSTGVSIAVLVNDDDGYECKAAISRALARVVLAHQ